MVELSEKLMHHVVADLEAVKADDITVLDVRDRSSVTDFMVIATGRSKRHARALAENVVRATKDAGHRLLGIEGEQHAEWILVDLCDVVVHVMLSETRVLYQLEKLWYNPRNPLPATGGSRLGR